MVEGFARAAIVTIPCVLVDPFPGKPRICHTQVVLSTKVEESLAVIIGCWVNTDGPGDRGQLIIVWLFCYGCDGVGQDDANVMGWYIVYETLQSIIECVLLCFHCKFCGGVGDDYGDLTMTMIQSRGQKSPVDRLPGE